MAYQPDLIVLFWWLGHNDVQMDVYQYLSNNFWIGSAFRVIGAIMIFFLCYARYLWGAGSTSFIFHMWRMKFKSLSSTPYLGKIDETQMNWLKKWDPVRSGRHFYASSTILVGIPHMDSRYAMEKRAEFYRSFRLKPKIQNFTGHYHTERTIEIGNVAGTSHHPLLCRSKDSTVEFTPWSLQTCLQDDNIWRAHV